MTVTTRLEAQDAHPLASAVETPGPSHGDRKRPLNRAFSEWSESASIRRPRAFQTG